MSEEFIGKKFDAQVNYGWGLTLNMSGKAPAISKRIFDKLSDAQSFADDYTDSAIEGLILSIVADDNEKNNGIYFVERIKKSIDDEPSKLIKVGYNEEKYAVETYDDALELATIDNIGKVIYVKNNYTYDEDSESEVVEYEAAPYIIVGEKSLVKLSTSSISFENEIAELKTKITSTEENIENISDSVESLKSDIFNVVAELTNDISDLTNEVVDLQSVKDEHSVSIKDLNDNLNIEKNERTETDKELLAEISKLNDKIDILSGIDSDNLEILDGVDSRLTNLENADVNFQETIDKINDSIESLKLKVEDLSNDDSDSDGFEILDDINNINEKLTELTDVDSKFQTELKELKEKVENIINADSDSDNDNLEIFNEINQQLNNLSKEDENIKNEINKLNTKLKWLDYNI